MTNNVNQNSWKETLIPIDSSIQQAIHSLEVSGMQIVLVVSRNNKLIGTLTDGDIRRAFLKGAKLDDSIDQVINRSPLVAPPEVGRNLILKVMQANKIFQIPVVDHDGKVLDLYVWDSVNPTEPLENIMVIMAGGVALGWLPIPRIAQNRCLKLGESLCLSILLSAPKRVAFANLLFPYITLGT